MSRALRVVQDNELTQPAWRFFRWWDEAMFTALLEATVTGRRHVVRRSRVWPAFWIVTEVGM